jgi:hypothetical protein
VIQARVAMANNTIEEGTSFCWRWVVKPGAGAQQGAVLIARPPPSLSTHAEEPCGPKLFCACRRLGPHAPLQRPSHGLSR